MAASCLSPDDSTCCTPCAVFENRYLWLHARLFERSDLWRTDGIPLIGSQDRLMFLQHGLCAVLKKVGLLELGTEEGEIVRGLAYALVALVPHHEKSLFQHPVVARDFERQRFFLA